MNCHKPRRAPESHYTTVKEVPPMSLTPRDSAKMLDHSTLQPYLTEEDIRKGCCF